MEVSELCRSSLNCIQSSIGLLRNGGPIDLVVSRLDSLKLALEELECPLQWRQEGLRIIETVIELLTEESHCRSIGRPRIQINVTELEFMLSLRFKITKIANIYGVSRYTVARRLREVGVSASSSYTSISDEALNSKIGDLLTRFPNTGYKRMKGFLQIEGLRITDRRVRAAMRLVDPEGVFYRTQSNRAIVRRQYSVTYFNEIWHLDTNLKLIRWGIVIRGCIDGNSRIVLYLDASGDNLASTNFTPFLKAVEMYGIPFRTRSDKGKENALIAQFMVEHRGVGRASHICGRSVHNQRIERYWSDVYYGYTSAIANVLTALEQDGLLNIDSPKHMFVSHAVFLPRMTRSLEDFQEAWNYHPLSTESNYTPVQIMSLSFPPIHHDLELTQNAIIFFVVRHYLHGYRKTEATVYLICYSKAEMDDVTLFINQSEDIVLLNDEDVSGLPNPDPVGDVLSLEELLRLSSIDVSRPSNAIGYDIFVEAINCLS